jgi:ABC-type uncharacterized transport system fused permease/ATPase subunit
MLLASVIVLTLTSSGVSVWFSYIGRDFWTALSTKNEPEYEIPHSLPPSLPPSLAPSLPPSLLHELPPPSLPPYSALVLPSCIPFTTPSSLPPSLRFYRMMRTFFGALVVGVPVNVMYKFCRQRLSLSWREWLTNRVTDVRRVGGREGGREGGKDVYSNA